MRMVVACGFLLAACSVAFADMGLGFRWGPTKLCFDPNSPPITVKDIPDGTVNLRFTLTDLDAAGFDHGGGEVSFNGQEMLPYGAFHYKGPCRPASSRPHNYELSMQALDASGKILATAQAERRFP